VKHEYDSYTILDLNQFPEWKVLAKSNSKLKFLVGNAELIPFKENTFNRIIVMCVLHHVDDVYAVLTECRRVVKNGGLISIYLPCDPGIIYKLARKMAIYRQIKKLNLDYRLINAVEHKNHVFGILVIINHVFKFDKIKKITRPFPIGGGNLNIYNVIQIAISKEVD
jgi:ubiquinone/menaquinone biosynthesis C-methylase UbiE